MTHFISRKEAAGMLSLSPKTLANWAITGIGPKAYNPSGGRAIYDFNEVVAWAKGQPTPPPAPVKRGRGRPPKHALLTV
jgi:hypothetical protein